MPVLSHNIQLLVQQNEAIAKAEHHCKTLHTGASVAHWHERSMLKAAAGGVTERMALKREQEQQVQMIKAAKQERQKRLAELYRQEALQYEAELNAKGLALSKHRE
jgi:hypothetical protein